ncbi:MAG: GNAT family protein [Bacteroidota bacterium]
MNLNQDIEISVLKPTDAWKLCDFVVSNEDRLRKYLPITVSENLTPTLSQIFADEKLKQINNGEEFLYTIKLCTSRELVGITYLKNIDLAKHQGEFAYAIDYRFTGNGIIPFVINRLVSEFSASLSLSKFQIITNKDNPSSIRVAEKCGFKWTKTLPKVFKPPGRAAMDMELYELSLA